MEAVWNAASDRIACLQAIAAIEAAGGDVRAAVAGTVTVGVNGECTDAAAVVDSVWQCGMHLSAGAARQLKLQGARLLTQADLYGGAQEDLLLAVASPTWTLRAGAAHGSDCRQKTRASITDRVTVCCLEQTFLLMLFDVTGLFGGSSLAERIRFESADDAQTLTLKDGSLVSVICIGGSMRHENADDLAAVANGLRISLAPLLSRPGHAIEFIFSRDPAASCRQLEQVFDLQRRHCRGLQLDLADILDAAQAKLSGVVNGESCLSVIYTRPAVNMTGGLGFDRQIRPEGAIVCAGYSLL